MNPGASMAALHELKRLLSGEIEAVCGARSSMGPFTDRMLLGVQVDVSFRLRNFSLDDESPQLRTLVKLRPASRAYAGVSREHQRLLRAGFGPTGTDRPVSLEAFVSPAYAESLGGVALLTPLAGLRHHESRTARGLVEWLQRLSGRHTGALPAGNRLQRRHDGEHVAELIAAAEQLVRPAVVAYAERWAREKARAGGERGRDAA